MKFYSPENGLKIDLASAPIIGGGGEGRVYEIPNAPNLVAKILNHPTDATLRKLEIMLSNPYRLHSGGDELVPLAWPVGLLFSCKPQHDFAGYLMKKVTDACTILNVYHPKTRRRCYPGFNYLYLHRAARNIASAVWLAHSRGYVIGDISESNLLVTNNATVSIVDVDSWQVRDPETRNTLRCGVGKPDFVPPELQGKRLSEVNRTEVQDRFALGVTLYKMLTEGVHPYDGRYLSDDEPPPIEKRIALGYFPHGRRVVPVKPKRTALPFSMLQPELRYLFIRCFEDGHFDPQLRPDAQMWAKTLASVETSMISCATNPRHWYGGHLKDCPWCARTVMLKGLDPFPSQPDSVSSMSPRCLKNLKTRSKLAKKTQMIQTTETVVSEPHSSPMSLLPIVGMIGLGILAVRKLFGSPSKNKSD